MDWQSFVVVALLVLCLLSFILRELACWYWKINESLGVLKEIRDLLAAQQTRSQIRSQPLSPVEREAKTAEKALATIDEKELERQALGMPKADND
jgi:hypothetical protein